MALRAERFLLGLALGLSLSLAVGLSAAPKEKTFDPPKGLLLKALDQGRWQLVWDPIDRDDLMGYSVWLRRPGEKEFTRLKIPVKVGKEIKQLPLTSRANIILALGSRRDLEFTVVAEYEDGSSPRSPSVFSRDLEASAPVPGAIPVPGAAPLPVSGPAGEGKAAEAKDAGASIFAPRLPQAEQPLITPLGTLRSELGLDFAYRRSIRSGFDRFDTLRLSGTAIPDDKMVHWSRTDVRTEVSVPLTLRWGLFPGMEVWAEGSYRAEDMWLDQFVVDGANFGHIRFTTTDQNGKQVYLSNPTSAGFGDTRVGLRLQPYGGLPMVLGVVAELPTGRSRFKSMLDWFDAQGSPAGTGLGATRVGAEFNWGASGRQPGLAFFGAYRPAFTERIRSAAFSEALVGGRMELEHVVVHGSELSLGGTYTFPWMLLTRPGAASLGIAVQSIGAATWTALGNDLPTQLFSPADLSHLAAHAQIKFIRDDQIEFGLTLWQDLPSGFRAGGRLSYSLGVQGDALRLGGLFYY
jgi:hypothetical protein